MKKLPLLLSLGVTAFFFACGDDSSSTKAPSEEIPNEDVQDSTQVPVANPDSTGNGEEMPGDSSQISAGDSIPGAEKGIWSTGSWAYKTDSSFCTITADTSFSADYNYTGVKGSVTCSYVRGDDPALEWTDSWAHVAYKFNPSPEKLDSKDGICLVYSSQTDLLLRIAPENEAVLTGGNNYEITLPAAKEVTVLNRKFAGFTQEMSPCPTTANCPVLWGKKVTLEQNLAAVTEIRIQSQNVYENSFHIVKIGNYGECGDLSPEDISQSTRDSIAAVRDSIKHYNDSLKQAAAEAAEARQNFIADSLQKAWLAELGLKGNYPLYPSVNPNDISEVVIEELDSSFWVGGLNWYFPPKTGFGTIGYQDKLDDMHPWYTFSNKKTESFDLDFDINNGGLFIEIDAKPNVYYGFGFDIVADGQIKGADVSKYKQINVAYSSTNLPVEIVLVPEQNEALIGDDLYEITQGDNLRFTLPATDGEIKEVVLPFANFAQKGWGVKQNIDDVVKTLGAIQFAVNGFTIDFDAVASTSSEIRIYGVGWE